VFPAHYGFWKALTRSFAPVNWLWRLPARPHAPSLSLTGRRPRRQGDAQNEDRRRTASRSLGGREWTQPLEIASQSSQRACTPQDDPGRSKRYCQGHRPAIRCAGTMADGASSRQQTARCASFHARNDHRAAKPPRRRNSMTPSRTLQPRGGGIRRAGDPWGRQGWRSNRIRRWWCLLEGVADALGVIVGEHCLLLPGDVQVLPARKPGSWPTIAIAV
jgi:hypothetical protein